MNTNIRNYGNPIKTFQVTDIEYLGRLAAMMIAVSHPFHFDGGSITMDCSEHFIEQIKLYDVKLGMVDFREVNFN